MCGSHFGWAHDKRIATAQLDVGRHDPNDPTHLTIGYTLQGQRGTINGWLQNNETIRFKVRDGPAAGATSPW